MNRGAIGYALGLLSLVVYVWNAACFGAVRVESNSKIPPGVAEHVKGTLLRDYGFVDALGAAHNLVLTTDSANKESVETRTIKAAQFVKAGPTWKLEWVINDLVNCSEDLEIEAKWLPERFTFTDLDNDGNVETTVSYSLFCGGDISAKKIKTIMREGGDKYAVRGESLVSVGEGPVSGGTFKVDEKLNSLSAFREHLVSVWKKAAGVKDATGRVECHLSDRNESGRIYKECEGKSTEVQLDYENFVVSLSDDNENGMAVLWETPKSSRMSDERYWIFDYNNMVVYDNKCLVATS